MAVIFLAACGGEVTATTEPAAQPANTPAPTPKPFEDFAGAAVPPADAQRLAQLTRLLSLVPGSYHSAVYLDMEFLRSNASLTSIISPDVLGLDIALPSFATGLVNTIAVAADFETRTLVTAFQGDFDIGNVLRLAGSFGLQLNQGGPQPYEGHDIWDINALGTVLAMARADAAIGVAVTGQGIAVSEARALAEASLDAFDGRSTRLLDAPGLTSLVGDVPSGFAAVVLSQCDRLALLADAQGLPTCTGAVVSAGLLPGELVVLHALIGFADQDAAASALTKAIEALESQNRSHGFVDLGVRQEGENVRVRVIVGLPEFSEAFRLFMPSR